VPFDAPLVLVLPEPVVDASRDASTQLFRIGRQAVAGWLLGGVERWTGDGRELRSYPVASMRELHERMVVAGTPTAVLDVRQPAEWRDDGTIPGSRRIFVADLADRIGELPTAEEWWVVCTTGHRSAIGASLLDRAGIPVRLVARGGTVGWIERFERSAAPAGQPG
jgi:rhodanese-related sulfurtransferase